MDYILWIIFLVAMLILEASTTNLVSIWFAAGALGAIVTKYLGGDLIWQICALVAMSALTLIIARPFIKKFRNTSTVATNADRLIGEVGIVTDDINSTKFAGQVSVAGREWSAVTENKSDLAAGTRVKIKAISGVKLVVDKIED